ncbi:hypothetical protein [Mycobacterium tuberculosis]|uniref:hypothetical protein n=1 Tax=Mycobacterium tuberculosis TaxID=1773 RepID=UPI001F3571EF|nr:hypothetical protein [Mycobacterium tuberculosis]
MEPGGHGRRLPVAAAWLSAVPARRSGGQRRHLFPYLLVSVALRRLWFHGTKAGIGDRCTEATTLALALLGFRAFQLGDPATSGAICFSANRRISLSSLWVALSIRLSRR